MATNILQDRILFSLRKLIESNTQWKCYDLKPHGATCIVLTPDSATHIASTTDGTVYRWTVLIDFHSPAAVESLSRLSQDVSDIVRVLNDNTYYQPSTSYYFAGMVDSIDYDWLNESDWKARITWSCTHEEVA